MGQIKIIVNNNQPTAENIMRMQPYSGSKMEMCNRVARLMGEVAEGRNGQSMIVLIDGGTSAAKASGTLTLASVVATNTCQVGSQTFTAVASGATGNQFNVGVSDTATAANLVAVINANSSLGGSVVASSSGAVVSITAGDWGRHGNQIQLVGGTHITASGSGYLAGGAPTSVSSVVCSGSL